MTDFIVSSAEIAAEEAIERHHVINLSARDSLIFAEAILNPAEPNENLRLAAERYRAFRRQPVIEARFRFEQLGSQHDRETFDCGVAALNRYLQQQASQDIRNMVATVLVMVDSEVDLIAGFYTLSAASGSLESLPVEIKKSSHDTSSNRRSCLGASRSIDVIRARALVSSSCSTR